MADPPVIPRLGSNEHNVLYINRSGRPLEAEVIGRGRDGGFYLLDDRTEKLEVSTLIVDMARKHDSSNAVRIAIPDGKMLVGYGGENGVQFRFKIIE